MKKLLIQILNKINIFGKSKNQNFSAKNRIAKIAELRLSKKSDIERWSMNESLYPDWDERTKIIGDYIQPNAKIIEFGAGNMVLKNYLKNYSKYTASDIVKRFEETIVCDLNVPIVLDLSEYNTVIFSGVLEYVYDINRVFESLSKNNNQVVVSYCCSDLVKLSRVKNGWLSDFTKSELEEIFRVNGYAIINYMEWRNQSIYNLSHIGL